uniref:Endoribonuclease Dcr-1 n=1 Tax=Lygus hesperus TaxID=30085 RepID=A0A0A9XX48_LYGHE
MRKQQKKKNPFKVDHVRSIKMKAKAKQYTGKLKQLKCVISDEVKSTNEQLSVLEDIVRQGSKKDVENAQTNKDSKSKDDKVFQAAVDQYNQSKKNEADTLDKLATWTCK